MVTRTLQARFPFHVATHVAPTISLTTLHQLFFLKSVRIFAVDINCYLDLRGCLHETRNKIYQKRNFNPP